MLLSFFLRHSPKLRTGETEALPVFEGKSGEMLSTSPLTCLLKTENRRLHK